MTNNPNPFPLPHIRSLRSGSEMTTRRCFSSIGSTASSLLSGGGRSQDHMGEESLKAMFFQEYAL
ncbi:hypothetical protein L484_013600 [Morus notabilis]|uniref:Uncharacterized protein n=1 Tax=Morus notabilis TaxID=981085 RepID=W9QF78_9ROSA|nr:hypothetical protein L484_013600 [Morus notabilis]